MIDGALPVTDWPETDALLGRFRTWLGQVREESRTVAAEPSPSAAGDATEGSASEIGLIDLVREFTALRHEIKLQTKRCAGVGGADRGCRCCAGGRQSAVPRR